MTKSLISMDGARARRVISISMPRTMIRFPSRKSGRTLHAESQNEAFLMMRLEVDPNVLRFREQPAKLKFAVNGKMQTYYPDIYAEQIDGLYVYEVKPESELSENKARFEAAKEYLNEHGYKFVVVTDKELRSEPELPNNRLLFKYVSYPVAPKVFDAARSILLSCGGCSIGQLADAIQLHGGSLHSVYSLIARGYAAASTKTLLCTNSMVTWR